MDTFEEYFTSISRWGSDASQPLPPFQSTNGGRQVITLTNLDHIHKDEHAIIYPHGGCDLTQRANDYDSDDTGQSRPLETAPPTAAPLRKRTCKTNLSHTAQKCIKTRRTQSK